LIGGWNDALLNASALMKACAAAQASSVRNSQIPISCLNPASVPPGNAALRDQWLKNKTGVSRDPTTASMSWIPISPAPPRFTGRWIGDPIGAWQYGRRNGIDREGISGRPERKGLVISSRQTSVGAGGDLHHLAGPEFPATRKMMMRNPSLSILRPFKPPWI
jgi:hypothetical protein